MRRLLIPVIASLFFLSACRDKDPKPVSDKVVYVEHKIRGEEGVEFVTVLLQFRQSRSGKNELVPVPGSVQLDGEILQGDSSAFGGGFYELRLPLEEFDGPHVIQYDDGKGEVLIDSFYFKRFRLPELLPVKSGKDWEIALKDLQDGDRLMVALTDTAFQTNDIVQVDTVQNSEIQIPAAKLARLANGPLHLELSILQTKSPGNGAKGSIEVEYRLRRDVAKRD